MSSFYNSTVGDPRYTATQTLPRSAMRGDPNGVLQETNRIRQMAMNAGVNVNGAQTPQQMRPSFQSQNPNTPSWARAQGAVRGGPQAHHAAQQDAMWAQRGQDMQNSASFMPSYGRPQTPAVQPYGNPYQQQAPAKTNIPPSGFDPGQNTHSNGPYLGRPAGSSPMLEQASNVAPVQTAQTVGGYWGGNASQQYQPTNSFGSWWM